MLNCNEYEIDLERAVYLGKLLREVADLIDLLEENDPQYLAVKTIIEHIGTGLGVVAVVGNAIVSYQLTSRGEIYWSMFSKWIVEKSPKSIKELKEVHKEFLLKTRYNVYSLKYKLRRLEKFYGSTLAKELVIDPFKYCPNINLLVHKLSKLFQADTSSKTMVFAGKMYYYTCRSEGKTVGGDIDLPVDRRNSLITITSCIIRFCTGDIKKCVEDLMKPSCRSIVINAWKIISKTSGIPIYRLDSLTWLIAGILKTNNYDPIQSYKYMCKEIGYCREKLKELFFTLTSCANNKS